MKNKKLRISLTVLNVLVSLSELVIIYYICDSLGIIGISFINSLRIVSYLYMMTLCIHIPLGAFILNNK